MSNTRLAGKTIFVYAGNMGVAQGLGIILELAKELQNRPEFGFLFVGRGSDVKQLRDFTIKNDLQNVFFDEIDPKHTTNSTLAIILWLWIQGTKRTTYLGNF